MITSNYELIQQARAAIIDAIENPETGLASAERALALLTYYLHEEN